MKAGRQYPDGIYGRLYRGVPLAESRFEVLAVAGIAAAGQDDPKYLCWLLERKFPQRWGKHRWGNSAR